MSEQSEDVVEVQVTQRLRVVCRLTRDRIRVTDNPIELEDPLGILLQSFDMKPLKEAVKEFKKLYVQFAVRKYGTHKMAADTLGIHRNMVYHVLNQK